VSELGIDSQTRDSETVELRIAAKAENIALARLALSGVASAVGASADVVADLKLAVSEACTNAVQHGAVEHAASETGDGRESRIVLRFTVEPGRLTVEIDDNGRGFAETRVESDGAGLGLTIIRAVTDELTIESGERGSRVTFVKRSG
jgi:serine/threonine-protein kinase RsbW